MSCNTITFLIMLYTWLSLIFHYLSKRYHQSNGTPSMIFDPTLTRLFVLLYLDVIRVHPYLTYSMP